MQVFISSGTHIDEVRRRVDTINRHLESPDVVFGEAAEAIQTEQIREIAHLFPRAPLIALGAAIQVLLVYPIGGLILSIVSRGSKGRDKAVMQRIKTEHGAEIQEIDLVHPALPVYESPLEWAVVNWIPLVAVPLFASRYYSLFDTIHISTLVLLLPAFVLFLIMLYVVNFRREDAMASSILSRTDDVDSACIVLGEAHHWGVGERLISHEEIDVINPTPMNPDWSTKLGRYIWKLFDRI